MSATAPAMSSGPELRCPTCHKIFSRRAHLKRHVESHSAIRPHSCPLCQSDFQRGDVLKRHLQTCEGSLASTPSKRRACDWCARQKKACSSHYPCHNCVKKNRPCLSTSETDSPWKASAVVLNPTPLATDAQPTIPEPFLSSTLTLAEQPHQRGIASTSDHASTYNFNDFANFSSYGDENAHWKDLFASEDPPTFLTSPVPTQNYRRCFEFLDRFTRNTGLILSFDCGTYNQRRQALEENENGRAFGGGGCEFMLQDLSTTIHPTNLLGEAFQPNLMADPLDWQTYQITSLVKEVVTVKPRNSAVSITWSSMLEAMCLQFFSPPNLRKFLRLYWTIWHPNVNFIHRPTFNPSTCKTILLASMALVGELAHPLSSRGSVLTVNIGACVSPDPMDAENAAHWFNCVEEMVFTDVDLSGDFMSANINRRLFDLAANKPKIHTLQAAYNVCLFQNWEGDDTSKRRIRRYRFGTVISVS